MVALSEQYAQKRVSRKEAEPRWDRDGPSIGGPRALVRSPWKVFPRVCGLRRGGLGSSGGCTTIRGISGLVPPRTPASCWDSKMAWAPGRRSCGRGAGPDDDLGSWASWILISRCRSRSERATLCTWDMKASPCSWGGGWLAGPPVSPGALGRLRAVLQCPRPGASVSAPHGTVPWHPR